MKQDRPGITEKSLLPIIYIIVVMLSVGVTGLLVTPLEAVFAPKRLPADIRLAGLSLGGLEYAQVKPRVELLVKAAKDRSLQLQYGEKSWTLTPEQLGLTYDLEATYSALVTQSRQKQGWRSWLNEWRGEASEANVSLQVHWQQKAAVALLDQIKAELDRQPSNAQLVVKDGKVEFTPHQTGRNLSVEESLKRIELALGSLQPERHVALAVRETNPQVTSEALEDITTVLAEASSPLPDGFSTARKNIAAVAARLNGKLIDRDQIFSFTREAGPFLTGETYITLPDIHPLYEAGGIQFGIGQSASALYLAALRANLEIRERHPHLQPQPYTSPGLDAAVWDGKLDLQVANHFRHPVYIEARVDNNQLVIRLYGSAEDKQQSLIKVEKVETFKPETVVTINRKLPSYEQKETQHGTEGILATVVRITEAKAGGLTGEEQRISSDYYRPIPKQVVIGTPEQLQNRNAGLAGNGRGKPADITETLDNIFVDDPNVASAAQTAQRNSAQPPADFMTDPNAASGTQ